MQPLGHIFFILMNPRTGWDWPSTEEHDGHYLRDIPEVHVVDFFGVHLYHTGNRVNGGIRIVATRDEGIYAIFHETYEVIGGDDGVVHN